MTSRPLECSQCKKTVKVCYKEIIRDSITCTDMCADCPILENKLHGNASQEKTTEKQKTLCCGNCGTSLESIKMGECVGCRDCYEIFADPLTSELIQTEAIPPALIKSLGTKSSTPLHAGRAPNTPADITLSTRLSSLNEALNEALKKENYEQAAYLRDQIKALEGKNHDS